MAEVMQGFHAEVAARANEIEAGRRLPADLVERLAKEGLFRAFAPEACGGSGLTAREMFDITLELAAVDASTAWVWSQGSLLTGFMTLRAPLFAEEVFEDPVANLCGSAHPKGTAMPVEGGFRLSGQWPWASGSDNATWFVGGASIQRDDGDLEMRGLYVHHSDVEILDTWNTLGMRGTGSHDFRVNDVFVPTHRTMVLGGEAQRSDLPESKLVKGVWYLALAAGAVLCGVARGMLRDVEERLDQKVPVLAEQSRAQSQIGQMRFARSATALDAVTGHCRDVLDETWKTIHEDQPFHPELRARVRAGLSYASEVAVEVIDELAGLMSGEALRAEHPFERRVRDAHTLRHHAAVYDRVYELAGRIMLGVDDDNPFV